MKLSKEQTKKLEEIQAVLETASTNLSSLATELREAWDAKSDKWQESDAGTQANDWIESFEGVSETLNDLEGEIAGIETEDNS